MNQANVKKLYTLKEACELLSISTATGRNWIKSGALHADDYHGSRPLFSQKQIADLIQCLSSGKLSALTRRRNKTQITGTRSYSSYIDRTSPNQNSLKQLMELSIFSNPSFTDLELRCILRDCAEKLLLQSGDLRCSSLLNDLASEGEFAGFIRSHEELEQVSYTYLPSEDTLGFLYLSLCCMQDRKNSGSYYTPGWLAKKLVAEHLSGLTSGKKILDPSCGSGMFLLQLPDNLPLSNLYGTDLNPVSITLARINLAMKYRISTRQELETLYQNITVADFLDADATRKVSNHYDIILGNPPWGARMTTEEKKRCRKAFFCAEGGTTETFDLFIEQSLRLLSPSGILSFVLPEAVLTVKAHRPVRQLLLENTRALSVEYLGEVFEQVHCPSILFTLSADRETSFCQSTKVITRERCFSTDVERIFSADTFPFFISDEEYCLLQKLLSCSNLTTLSNQADFALGIVTGNNAALLHTDKAPGLEPVIKGSDISRYHINSISGYVAFRPESFQQTAPEHLYRAPEKLFYRFINKQLTLAYDNTGLLSLNSCNILVPHIEGLSIQYILAVLNSSVAQFVFEKKFHSVKVLRSHLELLPIPIADTRTQEDITALVHTLMNCSEASDEYRHSFALLDKCIAELFELTLEEYDLLLRSIGRSF